MTTLDIVILSGEQIVNAAVRDGLLADEPVHYHELFNRLHRGGYVVSGKNPPEVLCANLHRHPLVKQVGPGTWRLDPEALPALRARVEDLRRQVVEHIDDPQVRDALIDELQRVEKTAPRMADLLPDTTEEES